MGQLFVCSPDYNMTRGPAVTVVTVLKYGRSGVWNSGKKKEIFLLPSAAHPTFYSLCTVVRSWGLKRPGRDVDYYPSSAEANNE